MAASWYNLRARLVRFYIDAGAAFGLTLVPLAIDYHGFTFWFEGDSVIWNWPWRRKGLPKWISIGFSGTGDFGDARFESLAALSQAWYEYSEAVVKAWKEARESEGLSTTPPFDE